MRRKLFTLAAGVSAMLCVGMCVFWVRGYWGNDVLWWRRHNARMAIYLSVGHGRLALGWGRPVWGLQMPEGPAFGYRRLPKEDDPYYPELSRVGVRFAGFGYESGFVWLAELHQLTIPFWPFASASALILARFWIVRRRRGLLPQCPCPRCGYDLRATPDRCPECGTVPAAKGERA